MLIALISLTSVVSGAALATVAERYPARVALLEKCSGVLLIGGFALLGSGLPHV
ncbi:MAG: hypothetical protein AB7O50_02935 [Pseudolabrys sp.]